MLTNVKNESFYRAKFRNRPIISIDGYDGTVHRGPFRKYHSRPIVMDGPDATVRDAFIKRLQSRPLDLDLTVEMRPARLNLGRYNPFNSAGVLIIAGGPRVHLIDPCRSIIHEIQRSSLSHVTYIYKRSWISPTREISWETVGFIIPDGL